MFLPHPRVKVSIVGSLRDREVTCSASDRQDSNFESCVWRTVSSQSSYHPQEVLLAQFSLYVHKGGLTPDSFHFFSRFFRVKSPWSRVNLLGLISPGFGIRIYMCLDILRRFYWPSLPCVSTSHMEHDSFVHSCIHSLIYSTIHSFTPYTLWAHLSVFGVACRAVRKLPRTVFVPQSWAAIKKI